MQSEKTRARILGKVLQIIHSDPVVAVKAGPKSPLYDELHLTLTRLPLEELSQIWQALNAG